HRAERSPGIVGQVVDQGTMRPVARANVFFVENPKISAITDSSGNFSIKPTSRFEPFTFEIPGPCGSEYFKLWRWYYPKVVVAHPDYQPRRIDAFEEKEIDLNRHNPGAFERHGGPEPIYLRRI